MTIMLTLLILDFVINPVVTYEFFIRFSFLLSGYLYCSFFSISDRSFPSWPWTLVIFIYLSELIFLYYLQTPKIIFPDGEPNNYNSWLWQGFEYGISKAHIATLLSITVFYLLVFKKYKTLVIILLISWPLILTSRSSISSCIALCLFHIIALNFNSYKIGIFTIFAFLSSLVTYSLFVGSFDRLHSYIIAFRLIKSDIFGIGLRNYYSYTSYNQDRLLLELSDYLSGADMFFNSTESMFADLIATRGIFGIMILFMYVAIFFLTAKKYKLLEPIERFILLFWGFLVFVGIGSDHTHLDALFFISLGSAAGLCHRSMKL